MSQKRARAEDSSTGDADEACGGDGIAQDEDVAQGDGGARKSPRLAEAARRAAAACAVDGVPSEVLALVLAQLGVADLAAFAGVCKRWFDIVDHDSRAWGTGFAQLDPLHRCAAAGRGEARGIVLDCVVAVESVAKSWRRCLRGSIEAGFASRARWRSTRAQAVPSRGASANRGSSM